MTTKQHAIDVVCKEGETKESALAKVCISPEVNSSVILLYTNQHLEPNINALIGAIKAEEKKIKDGDLTGIKKMLMSQAHTLDSLFTNYMSKALNSNLLPQLQIFSKIALKSQNQCRQTLATLAEIKNPRRTTFIKNQATNQQVNFNQNQTSPEKILNESNELLSEEHHAPMDITGTTTPSGVSQELAAMEA